jgi:hypothetical protein
MTNFRYWHKVLSCRSPRRMSAAEGRGDIERLRFTSAFEPWAEDRFPEMTYGNYLEVRRAPRTSNLTGWAVVAMACRAAQP